MIITVQGLVLLAVVGCTLSMSLERPNLPPMEDPLGPYGEQVQGAYDQGANTVNQGMGQARGVMRQGSEAYSKARNTLQGGQGTADMAKAANAISTGSALLGQAPETLAQAPNMLSTAGNLIGQAANPANLIGQAAAPLGQVTNLFGQGANALSQPANVLNQCQDMVKKPLGGLGGLGNIFS